MTDQRIQFVICGSCFWCASFLTGNVLTARCPCCRNNIVDSIPIATGESFGFDYNTRRGVTLDFAEAD